MKFNRRWLALLPLVVVAAAALATTAAGGAKKGVSGSLTVWVDSVDMKKGRVALTMLPPGE